MDPRFTHSFFAMGGARVTDALPGEWSAFAHHPPVLFLILDYSYNLCFDSSKTGPAVRTALRHTGVSVVPRIWWELRTHSIVDIFEFWLAIILIPINYPISMDRRIVDESASMWPLNRHPFERNGSVHTCVHGAPAFRHAS